MIIKERGITGEVFTVYSGFYVEDLVNQIIDKKCQAVVNWVKSLEVEIERSAIVGTYLTGMRLAEMLKDFSKVCVVDINPHLKDILNCEVDFSDDLSQIEGADLVVDTTGFGGLSQESVKDFVDSKIFLIEDPTSDGSDKAINLKNNIHTRLKSSKSLHKGILQTTGLNSKTSGTMTLTIEVLLQSLKDILKTEGVLYGVASMNFYEGIIFKEKDCAKFLRLLKTHALVISSMHPLSPDDSIKKYLNLINCMVEHVGF